MEILTQVLLVGLALLIMIVGVIGEILPAVPGMILIWVAALVYTIVDGFDRVGWWTIGLMILIWLIASGIDMIATWVTAKKIGVSWWGLGLSILGTIIGTIVFNFWGMLIGMIAGALIGEYIYHREIIKSLKAGAAVIIGHIFGGVLKLMMAMTMILIFLVGVVW